MTDTPLSDQLGHLMVVAIHEQFSDEQLTQAGSFEGLHELCDANEFVADAWREAGLDNREYDFDVINEALDYVVSMIWPEA